MINIGKLAQTAFQVHLSKGCSLATLVRPFSVPSTLTSFIQKSNFSSLLNRSSAARSILASPVPVLKNQVAGMKVRYALKKRCKDCYMIVKNERTYILCHTNPRHKQVQPVKKAKYTWILTSASQSKVRPW